MNDLGHAGPDGAAGTTAPRGFTRDEAARLIELKRRYDHGDFRELTDADRLRFARWLVEHGRLDEFRPAERCRRGGEV